MPPPFDFNNNGNPRSVRTASAAYQTMYAACASRLQNLIQFQNAIQYQRKILTSPKPRRKPLSINTLFRATARLLLVLSLLVQTFVPVAQAKDLNVSPAAQAELTSQSPTPSPADQSEDELPPDEDWSEHIPYVEIPDDNSYEETPGIPVQIRLSTNKSILLKGETAKLTVEVWRASNDKVQGLPVKVTLPPELKTTGNRQATEWTLPKLRMDKLFSREVQVKIADRTIDPTVVDIGLSVTPSDGRPTVSETLTVGLLPRLHKVPGHEQIVVKQKRKGTVLGAEDGRVMLLVPQGAVPEGTDIRFKRLRRVEPPSDELPDTPSIEEQLANQERESFHQWSFHAEHEGQEIEEFAKPLWLIYRAKWLADAGINPRRLALFTREDPEHEWSRIPIRYLKKRQILVAQLSHFSNFTAELEIPTKGDILPSVTNFSSDLFTGAATIRYPIELPAGPGGMAPSLSLNYSSSTVDDFYFVNRDTQNGSIAQSGLAGLGWNLGGIGYIALADHMQVGNPWDDKYMLVLNGIGSEIRHSNFYNGGSLTMVPEHFVKVDKNLLYRHDNDSTLGKVNGAGIWTVTSQDGTRHTFGTMTDPRPNAVSNSPQGIYVDFSQGRWQVNKWYLTESVDTSGNYITYKYLSDSRLVRPNGGNNCSGNAFYNDKWYYRSIRPDEILWGGNKDENHGHTMKVEFTYENRSDYQIADWNERCVQTLYSTKRLQKIAVKVKVAGIFKLVREYELGHGYSSGGFSHSKLNWIKHYGANANASGTRTSAPLNTYTFGYQQQAHHAQLYLTSADNGWGGKTTYNYDQHNTHEYDIEDDWDKPYNVVGTVTRSYRHRVKAMKVEDGLGNHFYTKYNYNNSRQRRWRGQNEYMGHDFAMTRTYKMNEDWWNSNEVVRLTVHRFYQKGAGGGNPDPRMGRQYLEDVWQPKSTLGNSCGNREENDFDTAVVYCLMSRMHTGWSTYTGSGANWTNTHDYFARPRWVRKGSETTHTEHQYATKGYILNQKRYLYQEFRQNGQQHGQVTRIDDYVDENNDGEIDDTGSENERKRMTVMEYWPHVSKNIVNGPSRIRVVSSEENRCISETRNIYDKLNSGYHSMANNSTAKGLVVKTETLLSGSCIHEPAIDKYDANWAVTHLTRDDYGNVTEEIRFGPNSSRDLKIRTDYDQTYHLFPIKRFNGRDSSFEERAKFYGVNRASDIAGSQWGLVAEHCAVNDICSRTKYDSYGRPIRLWERVTEGSSWGSDSSSTVAYGYNSRNSLSGLKTNVIAEARAPRCYGNFVRRHYNGLGQLVLKQTPQQNWSTNVDGCSPGEQRDEVDLDYGYDSLGNLIYEGMPHTSSATWYGSSRRISSYGAWNSTIKIHSTYDVLSRPTKTLTPANEVTHYKYTGRDTAIYQGDNSDNPDWDKFVQWSRTDGLGNLSLVKSKKKVNGSWQDDAEITLHHDVLGNLKTVVNAENKTATMTYDKASRKLSMDDPDLGNWSYAYDRQGNLTRQTDARGKTTCLYYQEKTNRLAGKHFRTDTSCPGSVDPYDIRYTYDESGRGPSKGKLTEVYYHKNAGFREKYWYYLGFLHRTEAQIPGLAAQNTKQYYDGYLRNYATEYPDGTGIRREYNSMGLQKGLCDATLIGNGWQCQSGQYIVKNAKYDSAGRFYYAHLPKGSTDLFLRHSYDPWTTANGRLAEIRVGTHWDANTTSSYDRLRLQYSWDRYGNIISVTERYNYSPPATQSFSYDDLNRLTSGYGLSYSWKPSGRFNQFEGKTVTYGSSSHVHAATNVSGIGSFSYDANGNMTNRPGKTLGWNFENRLGYVNNSSNNSLIEAYLYDDGGQRIKKWNGNSTVYYVGPHYEVQIGNGTVIAAGLAQSQLLLVEAGMSPEDATAAIYLPYLAGNGTDGDLDLEQETVQ
ncbi:MAG: hypothetical protein AAF702_15790, partial [Chloroflexota bacterium]